MREVVGEGALFTAGGVVFFQEGKQAGPKGCGPTMIPNSWARAFERYVSSSYPPRVILVQLLFRCNPTMIKIYGFPCNWTSVYIYSCVRIRAWSYIVWKSSWKRYITHVRIAFLSLILYLVNVKFHFLDRIPGNFYIILYIFINDWYFIIISLFQIYKNVKSLDFFSFEMIFLVYSFKF